jgi:two-component system sensor histidine kinase KdpD
VDTIVVLRDVTEAHQRQLVRDTFLGILSHELRTPVTTIYGAAKVLERHSGSAESPRREELVADIAEEAERLHRLVENVIALTRFGDAPGDVGRDPVLLQRIVPGAIAAERSRWPGVDFDVDLEPGLPTVIADPTYLEQVVRNLLGNAAKYAGEKGPIRVTAEATAGEVIVRVLDRGPGFDAQDAPRLFELYYRAQATAGLAAGAGIGLFVCSRLMSAMGGRIWGRPRAGGGSEFGLALSVMDDA